MQDKAFLQDKKTHISQGEHRGKKKEWIVWHVARGGAIIGPQRVTNGLLPAATRVSRAQ